ncbi:AaceriAFL203Cp [[Ashbya] aceris (nom. inval.)]|nr:AaceriAFL203Cp [[Ashbya] aceris (nom. inval.)]
MLKWIQGGISSVTGIAEPEYGPEFIHSATERVRGKQPFHETSREDLAWRNISSTHVETATFYFTQLQTGMAGFAQIIYSKIGGLPRTAQFTFRLHYASRPELGTWTSTKLENFRVEGANFYADNLSLELDSTATSYTLKSSVTAESVVDITFQRLTPGVKVGEDPTTYYGDNTEQPWGTMRHVFWPRNSVNGTVVVHGELITLKNDFSVMILALQGMKPHHAAKAWNFLNFQSETHSVVLMEFTTPKSYANTKVSIGIICDKDSVLSVTIDNEAEHVKPETDEVGWPVPKALSLEFNGIPSSVSDKEVASAQKLSARVDVQLKNLVERVDVMAEIPAFVKNIVSGVVGTKPYIYQYADEASLTYAGSEYKGFAWSEVTFISEFEN